VDPDLAPGVLRGEGDHQRVREGPGLAPEIVDPPYLDPDLLHHLSSDGLLQRFAGLDESREHAVDAGLEVGGAAEQDLTLSSYGDDHRWVEARIVERAAAGALLGQLVPARQGRLAAAATKTVSPVPLQELRGSSEQAKELVGDPAIELAEPVLRQTRRHLLRSGEVHRPAEYSARSLESLLGFDPVASPLQGGEGREVHRSPSILHQDPVLLEGEAEGLLAGLRVRPINHDAHLSVLADASPPSAA